MSESRSTDLLADLARLATKYGVEDWERLLDLVGDDSRRGQITALLRELTMVSSEARSGKKTAPSLPRMTRMVAGLKAKDPEAAELLDGFRQRLANDKLFPTVHSLRMFAETVGLQPPTVTRREQAINQLLRQLIGLPPAAIRTALAKAVPVSPELGEDYRRWVEIILSRQSSGENS